MAVKIQPKQLVEMAEKAAGKGAAATDDFLELLGRQTKKVQDDFDRLLDMTWKPSKPTLPPASKPEPVLRREPASAPKPKTEPKTAPKLDPSRGRRRKEGEQEKLRGVITLQDAIEVVRDVLERGSARIKGYLSMIPVIGTAIGIKDMTSPSESEIIAGGFEQRKLFGKRPRERERLAVAGTYPNGTRKIDVMRRVGGAGYKPSGRKGDRPDQPATRKRKGAKMPVEKDPSPSPNADDEGALVSPVATDEQKRAIAERRKKARQ